MNIRTMIVSLIMLAAAFALLSFLFMFSIDENQVAIRVMPDGEVRQTNYQPGLHFMLSVGQLKKFDKRIITHNYEEDRYQTTDGQILRVDSFARWQIVDVGTYYKNSVGNEDLISQRLGELITNALKDMFAKRTLQQVVAAERAEYNAELFDVVSSGAKSLGIKLIDARIRKISVPDSYNDSVYNAMRNGFKQNAAQYQAQGEATAQEIEAQADREQVETIANAKREAAIIRGDGDAKAAAIYSAAYNRNPEFYSFYRSLQAYRTSLGKSDDVLVVSPDSDFFRYLNKPAAR